MSVQVSQQSVKRVEEEEEQDRVRCLRSDAPGKKKTHSS